MLKIYFDWNCITHSKDDYPYILNIAEECRDRFIFPFSNAHIRDLLVSHNNSNVFFDSDLNLLERICGNNYLLFENGQMLPKLGTPRDVIDISGDTIEAIQKLELISPETYHSIKEEVRKHLPSIIFKKIQGANPKDVILSSAIRSSLSTSSFFVLERSFLPNHARIVFLPSPYRPITWLYFIHTGLSAAVHGVRLTVRHGKFPQD